MIVGERIKKARKNRGLTQEQLGKILSIDKTTLSHYENSRRSPDIETLMELARVLKVDINYFIGADYDTCLDKESHHLTKSELNFILKLRKSRNYENIMLSPERYIRYIDDHILPDKKSRI